MSNSEPNETFIFVTVSGTDVCYSSSLNVEITRNFVDGRPSTIYIYSYFLRVCVCVDFLLTLLKQSAVRIKRNKCQRNMHRHCVAFFSLTILFSSSGKQIFLNFEKVMLHTLKVIAVTHILRFVYISALCVLDVVRIGQLASADDRRNVDSQRFETAICHSASLLRTRVSLPPTEMELH